MIRPTAPVRLALWALAALVLALLYGPLVVAIFFSFFRLQSNQVQWDSFSFDAYGKLFRNENVIGALGNTLLVGIAAVTAALVFGAYRSPSPSAHRGRTDSPCRSTVVPGVDDGGDHSEESELRDLRSEPLEAVVGEQRPVLLVPGGHRTPQVGVLRRQGEPTAGGEVDVGVEQRRRPGDR